MNNEAPSSCNTTVYLSWLLHSEEIMGGKVHASGHENCGHHNVRENV